MILFRDEQLRTPGLWGSSPPRANPWQVNPGNAIGAVPSVFTGLPPMSSPTGPIQQVEQPMQQQPSAMTKPRQFQWQGLPQLK